MKPENFKKVRIGILEYSSFLDVSDSVKRAMIMAKKALQKLGYDVVPIKFDQEIFDNTRKAFAGMIAANL